MQEVVHRNDEMTLTGCFQVHYSRKAAGDTDVGFVGGDDGKTGRRKPARQGARVKTRETTKQTDAPTVQDSSKILAQERPERGESQEKRRGAEKKLHTRDHGGGKKRIDRLA